MLHSVSIKNFQSLKSLDLELGPLTVVVGDSSSGKTALIRALRMLVNNERGSWFVTNGETVSSVSVRDSKSVVSLQKGVSNSGEYRIHQEGVSEKTFTKLAGTVPVEVSDVLGIASGSLNFAFQFDPPFLLKESGSAVATTLGSLTGVSRIFEAVREANRKRLAASALIKTRTSDLLQVQERLDKFGDLEERDKKLTEAEWAYQQHLDFGAQARSLQTLIEVLLEHKKSLSAVIVPEAPDLSEIEEVLEKREHLNRLLRVIKTAMREISEASADQLKAEQEQQDAETRYHEELKKAGRCPTCQQEIVVS